MMSRPESPSRQFGSALVAFRRQHYYGSLREQIRRGGQSVVIIFALTSLLIPMVVGALIEQAVFESSGLGAGFLALVLLQAIGIAWAIPQARAITGAPYQGYLASLPVGQGREAYINVRVLLEADALLGLLWLAGVSLVVSGFSSHTDMVVYVLRAAAACILVMSAQYLWLWGAARSSSLVLLAFLDIALIVGLYSTRNPGGAALPLAILVLAFAASASICTIAASPRLGTVIGQSHGRAMAGAPESPQSGKRSLPFVPVVRFYRDLLLHGVRDDFVLRSMLSTFSAAITALVAALHSDTRVAPVLWLAGAALAGNIVAGLKTPMDMMHTAARGYHRALPLDQRLLGVTDSLALCVVVAGIALGCCLLGLLLAPQLWPAFLAGIPLATTATLINLTVGRRFSRHGVVLSFALNASLIAAFAYLI